MSFILYSVKWAGSIPTRSSWHPGPLLHLRLTCSTAFRASARCRRGLALPRQASLWSELPWPGAPTRSARSATACRVLVARARAVGRGCPVPPQAGVALEDGAPLSSGAGSPMVRDLFLPPHPSLSASFAARILDESGWFWMNLLEFVREKHSFRMKKEADQAGFKSTRMGPSGFK